MNTPENISPRPWRIVDDQSGMSILVDADGAAVDPEFCGPDAHHIIRAVNAYDGLVEALKEANALEFAVVEPNGADIPDHLEAYLEDLNGWIIESQHIVYTALQSIMEGE